MTTNSLPTSSYPSSMLHNSGQYSQASSYNMPHGREQHMVSHNLYKLGNYILLLPIYIILTFFYLSSCFTYLVKVNKMHLFKKRIIFISMLTLSSDQHFMILLTTLKFIFISERKLIIINLSYPSTILDPVGSFPPL